ncbi:hypothetical protein J2Y45_003072 [Dyadobacter sp. BE34]|uniref:Transmembrane protein n=1 Tax=Dyadobacter fermentans TaxID=94254 RepID=A0ABU1QV38_9BACT|nr:MULTISPECIES: hypothetical protein [Dyadobacter]MDR6804620.1 hypothetical protein [Dyadobacter fermentans]MDR7043621.1 hypothetical protein [Dyadobacter sp. BE242]MDR7197933.1 hypothetical protein [Dyadobacter sp. BE34]MDR7214634.1 hypothetical protein [Dyadobacter sp. BE31]MDR7262169.1 hypothetical protein [Dyadobacter sp. BE32]
MMRIRFDILPRLGFLICLGLLLVNDFYLKQAYTNFWTGKMSDFAGLFIFPYFLAAFRIKSAKEIYLISALLFVFWKSEFSQFLIEFVRSEGIGVNRVVDYTDLMALLILPVSYKELQRQAQKQVEPRMGIFIAAISLFAILATTLPHEEIALNSPIGKVYKLPMSKSEFFQSLQPGNRYTDTLSKNLTDSLFYLYFNIPDYRADMEVLATIVAGSDKTTLVRLDTVLTATITGGLFGGIDEDRKVNIKQFTPERFEEYFEENFIEKVRDEDSDQLYYYNKETYEFYNNP